MRQTEDISALSKALVAAQAEFPTIPKNSRAYGYMYANLDDIVQAVRPILARHGLCFVQSVETRRDGAVFLFTRLMHETAQFIESRVRLPDITNTKNNAAQVLGMSITYMRRYALCAMLGITSDEDTDANAPQVPRGNQGAKMAQEAARDDELPKDWDEMVASADSWIESGEISVERADRLTRAVARQDARALRSYLDTLKREDAER